MESAENHEQQSQVNQPQADKDVGSLSRIETIKLINDSIDRLEATIKGIESNDFNELPSSESIDKLVSTTERLANTVAPPPVLEPAPIVAETPPTVVTSEPIPPPVKESTPSTASQPPVKENSSSTPNKPPTIKELKQQQAISNKKKRNKIALITLGGIALASAIAALVWFGLQPKEIETVSLPPATEIVINNETNSQPKVPEVIKSPVIDSPTNSQPKVPEVIKPPVINSPTITETKEPEQIVIKTPSPTSAISDTASEVNAPTAIAIPPDLASPGRAKNLKIVTIEPELTFTPEQTFVAALQGKIAELINNDEANIVNSIKVDLPNNSLVVAVKDNWYQLNESRQNKFANEILQRSRKLNFSKLEVQDAQGSLVARNPVIGDQIIIVQSNKKEVS